MTHDDTTTKQKQYFNVDPTKLDFLSIRRNIIDHFKNDPNNDFTDWDFDGSNLSTIIDVLAYNTHYNAMVAHMGLSESFVDSAQLRSSVVSAAKLVGYLPRSYSAAHVEIVGEIAVKENLHKVTPPDTITLPVGTVFHTTFEARTYQFTVMDSSNTLTKSADGKNYIANDDNPIIAYEGTLQKVHYTVDAEPTTKYLIPSTNVDISTISVTVRPHDTASAKQYIPHRDIVESDKDALVYFLSENSDGLYEISFGDGVIGTRPFGGEQVTIEYLTTSGELANGIGGPNGSVKFQMHLPNLQDAGSLVNDSNARLYLKDKTRSTGGGYPETIDQLRDNAINTFAHQDRGVTPRDYSALILQKFQAISSVSVWGGETNDPPEYGKVFICPKPRNEDASSTVLTHPRPLTEEFKNDILSFLATKRILAIEPKIVDPKYINIVLDILYKYDPQQTTLSMLELNQRIHNDVIKRYNDTKLVDFSSSFRHSNFVSDVDNCERSIVSSIARVYSSQEFTLKKNVSNTVICEYGLPLAVEHGRTIIKTTLSGKWTESNGGSEVFLSDEPSANRHENERDVWLYRSFYDKQLNELKTFKLRLVGKIYLDSGVMRLDDLFTDDDLQVKVIVATKSNDIIAKRENLLQIDLLESTINGYVDEYDAEQFTKTR